MPGARLGYEAPTAVHNCQIGRNVRLNGGFFYKSTFLEKATMGSGSQVRESCLLEEGSRGAHTVGLKHTILFPYVTLGSLINFCDCLMAGGTNEKNHSEVGSSYIHFNYTPDQDKSTPSLIGDVPRGVMINQSPIFLGGQGGIAGPVTIEYGTVVAAGTIVRKDILKKDSMLLGNPSLSKIIPFRRGIYSNLTRIVKLNTLYISNLIALRRWYLDVRSMFIKKDDMEKALLKGAIDKIEAAINERLKQMGNVASNMPRSIDLQNSLGNPSPKNVSRKKEFFEKWGQIEQSFKEGLDKEGDLSSKDRFLEIIEKAIASDERDYIAVIKGLNFQESGLGISWLQGLVDEISGKVWSIVPSMEIDSDQRFKKYG
jgi:UDP-N-acetylglucosamine/UDP-N-acetylgalactosamine diphosphorylase